ncbi:endo-1,3-alpha-glucanase family glycosylhydrolase [Ancylobacter pratisalsi]|uniref:Glycoside hydrolase family 71 protein n=1 Tax=Ancylobacter pratisalsi TaxID=1745854 RepID=A0A6P1YQ42_9HYPH|nr:endo-1,3-alpha-glucanase family glycosylhydrolase [Ancylobacter pratisalsi]QIB34263.1 hypothetical protein G3A50_11495 [Ancylobacter pratisalsi]
MRRLLGPISALLMCILTITSVEARDYPNVPRLVFAHYMLCCPMTATPTVEDFREEIRLAKSAGIDGFAVNIGSWTGQPVYQARGQLLYEAARLEGDFKLFLSLDTPPVDEAVTAVKEMADQPASLRVDGKLVVSTFGGPPEWSALLREALTDEKIDMFYVPNSGYWGRKLASRAQMKFWGGDPAIPNATAALSDIPMDGYFYFGADRDFNELATSISSISQIMHASGKIFMAGVSPYYRGIMSNARMFDGRGFEGMQKQWMAAIESKSDWVEIVTWNDWNESTYIAETPNWKYPDSFSEKPLLLDHSGFRKASEYYIKWFKTGAPPPITQDRVIYFYVPHMNSALGVISPKTGERGRPRRSETLEDKIYFTAFLTAPITLTVRIGETTSELSLPAGVTNVSVPKETGDVDVDIRREGAELTKAELPFPVTDDGAFANFNYQTGELNLTAP